MVRVGQHQFFLFLICLVNIIAFRPYDLYVERLICIRSPNDICHNLTCGTRPINRLVTHITIECDFAQPMSNLTVRITLYYKYSEYRKFLIDVEDNVCDYLDNKTAVLLHKIAEPFMMVTNIRSCPINATRFILKNLDINSGHNVPFVPAGRYRADIRFISNGQTVFDSKLYYSAKPRGILKLEMG